MYGLCSLHSIVHTSWAPESLYTDFCIRVQSGARLFILYSFWCIRRVPDFINIYLLTLELGVNCTYNLGSKKSVYRFLYTCTIWSPTPHSGAYKWSHILYICMYRLNTNTRTIWNPTPHFCVYKGFQIS